jgi:hypothetical protein
MKTITLWQPWASLIAMEYKTIETRTHDLFRGLKGQRIAIHAGKHVDRLAFDTILKYARPHLRGEDLDRIYRRCPKGAVVCTAMVTDARWMCDQNHDYTLNACIVADGKFGLFLSDIEQLIPAISCAGHQGIWNWERS